MQPSIHRPTVIQIDRDALRNNYLQARQLAGSEKRIFAVVKADAYHHGAVVVAQILHELQVDGFCVATIDEALELRTAGITEQILVLGLIPVQQAPLAAQNDISVAVGDLTWLQTAAFTVRSPLKVHLALDTGMGRIGFREKSALVEACQFLKTQPQLIPEGIFTHFATADELSDDYFQQQLAQFEFLIQDLPITFENVHCANSATSLWHRQAPGNLIRLGIGLYGLNPAGSHSKQLPYSLQPALSLTSQIVAIKQLPAGQSISYGATYTTEQPEIIATVPLGYADGWQRRMTGSKVLVDGHLCPIVGRICMDQLMIKVPKFYPLGTLVTFIGQQNQQTLSADVAADYGQTINYEILCNLSDRIPRKYIN
ncbi:alanine racemase [Bombilactobacillus folatiphilus]|uniref:Alanine racemase n=1 Tax=Bombilactobacillus folatiphilus TaxID=2923362 RepID=A0ABY4P9V8_9LACO|nr:alanine racemase [Bombilactobacillus folatiphilus]UQS82321.1 alanine racemase [Bombilactobacillus folatiphilus]